MIDLVKRHLLYTIRDRFAFVMSFLSVAILIVVYKAFLGEVQLDALKQATGHLVVSSAGLTMLNYSLVADIVVVAGVTSVVNALGVSVDDAESGKFRDFILSGSSKNKIYLSYYISAFVLGLLVTILSLIFGILIFVGFSGLSDFTLIQWLELLALVIICNIVATLSVMPILRFIKTRSGFSSFSTIIGTLIGFLAGAYIAIGSVGASVRNFMTFLPFAHQASLFKQILLEKSQKSFFENFPVSSLENYNKLYGKDLFFPNGDPISIGQSLVYLIAWILVLTIVNLIVNYMYSRRSGLL